MAKKWTIEKIEQLIVQRDFSLDEKNSLQPIINKSLNEQNDFKKLTGLEVSSISEFNYHSILMRIFKRVLPFYKDSVPPILDETYLYIDMFSAYPDSLYGKDLEITLRSTLEEYKLDLDDGEFLKCMNALNDLLFIKYIYRRDEKKPEIISELIDEISEIQKIILKEFIDKLNLSQEDIDGYKNIVIQGGQGKPLSMSVPVEVRNHLKDTKNGFQPLIDLITLNLGTTEEDSRKILTTFLDFNPSKLSLVNIKAEIFFDILLGATKKSSTGRINKQKACSVFHDMLQPIISQFHSKEEYVRYRGHGVFDKKSYKQHQRDSVLSFLKK